MGSGSSRLGSRPSRTRVNRRKTRISSLMCGTSRSHAAHEMEDDQAEILTSSARQQVSALDGNLNSSVKDPSLVISPVNGPCSIGRNGMSCNCRNSIHEEISTENGERRPETIDVGKCLSESKELVPCQAGYSTAESYWERTNNTVSTSKDLQPAESAPVDAVPWLQPLKLNDQTNEGTSQACRQAICSSSTSPLEPGDSHPDGPAVAENHDDELLRIHSSDPNYVLSSDPPLILQSPRVEPIREAAPESSESLQSQINGSVVNVDVVSISSNILASRTGEVSSREARRHSRRLFWDAFSRRNSRRHSDSPVIVFSTEDTDDIGYHDRWLLDFSGDAFENGIGDDLGYLNSRSNGRHGRRWHSRNEFWERLHGGLDDNNRRTAFCASGLHPDGTCSCETFLEDSDARASISRIVMLAEALFEVLDELHRQPVSLSFSMVSVPAPEHVVNSFPLKVHTKTALAKTEDDVEQCYICLVEYEEGDKIRVLPCRHEYHMSCVDKWLKEIHGVCPLCRRDVCAGFAESSTSKL